jgi:hypothetical protein
MVFFIISNMKRMLVIISTTLLAACTAYKPAIPLQSDADRAAKGLFPGITLTDLEQGKSIFEKSCKKCHSLKRPFTRSGEKVEAVLPKMAKKAKLDSKQEDLVRKYLLTMNGSKSQQ